MVKKNEAIGDKKSRESVFPKYDARKLFILLAAIERLERPTIITLSAFCKQNKATIEPDVQRLVEQFGVDIVKEDAVYRIVDWGEILKKEGVRNVLKNYLNRLD